MTIADTPCTQHCLTCVTTKHTRSGGEGKLIVEEKTATIYAVMCGPMRATLYGGSLYFLKMMVAQQRYVRVKLLNSRKNLEGYFHDYICWMERHTKMKVGRKHTKNAAVILR